MRRDIEHLPALQQRELDRVKHLLMHEFAEALSLANQPWKKAGKILKIILFGSYSRSDWVDEPANGYQSDFDLLVIVSHEDLTDVSNYWYIAEDRIGRDPDIGRPVNIIVHTLDDVSRSLKRGEYFWVDIARDGIVLYELPGSALATPMPLTAADAFETAQGYYDSKLPDVDRWLDTVNYQIQRSRDDMGFRKMAAFNLHQATETAYACFLLVRTLYFPRSHNVRFLRSLSEDHEQRLTGPWPREARADRRRFELLKRAYVDARYSDSYEIGSDDLAAIATSVRALRDVVEQVSHEWLERLRTDAGL